MANSLFHDVEFEKELDALHDKPVELVKVIARRVNYMSKECPKCKDRITALENQRTRSRKEIGAITGGAMAVIVTLLEVVKRIWGI